MNNSSAFFHFETLKAVEAVKAERSPTMIELW